MCIPCDKIFLLTPKCLTSGLSLWNLTYFWKTLSLAITFEQLVLELSYSQYIPCDKTFCLVPAAHYFAARGHHCLTNVNTSCWNRNLLCFFLQNFDTEWPAVFHLLVSSGTLKTAVFPDGNRLYLLSRPFEIRCLQITGRWSLCVYVTPVKKAKTSFKNLILLRYENWHWSQIGIIKEYDPEAQCVQFLWWHLFLFRQLLQLVVYINREMSIC